MSHDYSFPALSDCRPVLLPIRPAILVQGPALALSYVLLLLDEVHVRRNAHTTRVSTQHQRPEAYRQN